MTKTLQAPPGYAALLKDIKERLDVSESRVSQIHAQAVIHLRHLLRDLRTDLGFREGDPTLKQKYVRKPD